MLPKTQADLIASLGLQPTQQDPFDYTPRQPQSTIEPLSPFERIKSQITTPSNDPVIANIQKLGGLAKDILIPQSFGDLALEVGLMAAPPLLAAKKTGGLLKKTPLENILKSGTTQKIIPEDLPKVNIDVYEFDEIADWATGTLSQKDASGMFKRNPDRFLKTLDNTGLKKNSQTYLKNLADQEGNITVYRYLNLGEGGEKVLRTEKGLASTTLSPKHAVEKAQAESIKNVLIPQKGYKPSVLQTDFDKQAAIAEGLLVPRKMDRQPFVIEYKVPVNKVEGYMPVIKRSIDEENIKRPWMRKTADESYYNEIDELVEEGYEYGDALDEVAYQQQLDYDFDDALPLDMIDDEAEAIINLKGIQPSNVYKIGEGGKIIKQ